MFKAGVKLLDAKGVKKLLEKCPEIKWHFIGTVQSNKVAKIVKTANLDVVETVASQKLAEKFQNSCQANKISDLGVMIQVSIFEFQKSERFFVKSGKTCFIEQGIK